MAKRINSGGRITAAAPSSRITQTANSWRDNGTVQSNSSTARGYGYQWQKARAHYLADNPLCVIRGDGCTLGATVVDHRKPHNGDQVLFWMRSNWQACCKHCHDMHKQRIESADKYAMPSMVSTLR